jgi:hypothetical protein
VELELHSPRRTCIVSPVVRYMINDAHPQTTRIVLLESRFLDLDAGCRRRLLHRDPDAIALHANDDAHRVDALAQSPMTDRIRHDLGDRELDVVDAGLQLPNARARHGSPRDGSRFRARDDVDLVFRDGLIFHRFWLPGRRRR